MKTIELDDELFKYLLEEEIQMNFWEAEQDLCRSQEFAERQKSLNTDDRAVLAYKVNRKNCLERFLAILKAAE